VNHDPSPSGNEAGEGTLSELDVTVPVSARIWNYWMGGKDYYQVDKRAGDEFVALFPGIRNMARVSRLFLGRGLEAVDPGIVPVQQWRPDQRSSRFPADINMWGGAAVKR
jgi:hypothetical protein